MPAEVKAEAEAAEAAAVPAEEVLLPLGAGLGGRLTDFEAERTAGSAGSGVEGVLALEPFRGAGEESRRRLCLGKKQVFRCLGLFLFKRKRMNHQFSASYESCELWPEASGRSVWDHVGAGGDALRSRRRAKRMAQEPLEENKRVKKQRVV